MKKLKIQSILAILAIVCAIYIGLYCIDSWLGGYWLQPDRDGRDQHSMGLSMTTAIQWQPRWGYQSKFSSDYLGVLFSPLAHLDRLIFHETKYLTDQSTFVWLTSTSPSEIHPHFREDFVRDRKKAEQGAAANP